MAQNVAQKLIEAHTSQGEMTPGSPIALAIDQTLTQDATGTLAMLALEALNIDRIRTEVSVQYVDHNLLQVDNLNADDHLFLESACARFGLWFSRPGNGISHVVHMQRFGKPKRSLLGSDSHTPAAGALGMLAIGAGGLDVALAMTGEPFITTMPRIWGVELTGKLPAWVSVKDVILELLRRHGVAGGVGKIIEYHGPGLANLTAMDRHVIANMGAELGATSTVFPADDEVKRFLESEGRGDDFTRLEADAGADYDDRDQLDLSALEPLIAKPASPGNVVPVTEVVGEPIYQAYIGSSANPGWRDFAIAAEIVRDRQVPTGVSFDVNPSSRQLLEMLTEDGRLGALIAAGARLHQAGCNGCIGMGQAPAIDRNSLRTVPRNFPGRSGTPEDRVWLCSPETAAASALQGAIADPRDLDRPYPALTLPERTIVNRAMLQPPPENNGAVALVKGPNIKALPELAPLPDKMTLPVLLKMADDISTDEIMPAGARVLPYRSNIQKIDDFSFERIDTAYLERARDVRQESGHAVVAGENYGQGSSREHAAIAPRNLGLRVALAKSFARIHRQNLINYGVLPLTFADSADYDEIERDDEIQLSGLQNALQHSDTVELKIAGKEIISAHHNLTAREIAIILAGSRINWRREQLRQGD